MFKVQSSKLDVQSSKLIEIEHLSAGYDGKQVLHDINLTIYQDDYLGIIGPNGGGKTTLMRLILSLMKPTEGKIKYYKDGQEVKEIRMGYLPSNGVCHGSGKTYQTGSKKRKKSICKIKCTAEETSSAVFNLKNLFIIGRKST